LRSTVARKGGEALVRKRFHAKSIDWAPIDARHGYLASWFRRRRAPLAPFKIFVLGGVAADRRTFVLAIGGRGVRYRRGDAGRVVGSRAATARKRPGGALILGIVARQAGGVFWWKKRSRSSDVRP
jgi:hypothetical protein